jgi:hypothetical protein
MKHDDALAALNTAPLPELGDLRSLLDAGDQMLAEKKRRETLQAQLHAVLQEGKATQQHDALLDSLRTAVYDSDLKIPGKTAAVRSEVDEALQVLVKGGSYDDNRLTDVVAQLFAIEGRAATGAIAGKFAEQERIPADLPTDDCAMTANVTSVGSSSQTDEDKRAAKELAEKLRKEQDKLLQSSEAAQVSVG